MGQSLKKLTPGSEVKDLMDEIAQRCYDDEHFVGVTKAPTSAAEFSDFYRAVCQAVEEINSSCGNTQFRVPKKEDLQKAFEKHHKGEGKFLTKEEFQKILQEAIMDTGFTGIGAKDILLYIFGVPATALLIKQGILPKALPNEIFIPAVTSATVFALAIMNKI